MSTKKIFLASSSELESDRRDFEIFINRKNKHLIKKGCFLELVIWEDFLDAMSQTRLQEEYNKAIRDCDIFVMLFFTKVGLYTEEEFETAFRQFKATGKPLIYTFFKDAPITTGSLNKQDTLGVFTFQERLKALGHFCTHYQNRKDLILKFFMQLDKLLEIVYEETIFVESYAKKQKQLEESEIGKEHQPQVKDQTPIIPQNIEKKKSSKWLDRINQTWRIGLKFMDIERKALIQDLEQFAVAGNGIVIGKPGVGKSHSLLELRKLFKEKEIPHLFLPIDQLGDGTDNELRNILYFKGNLISKLREEINQLERTTPGIILFDAFDAARNEEIRERFVNLINRIISELKGLWNVIVTVRTYDAEKSDKLLKLFGNSSPNSQSSYNYNEVNCRHFMIPVLSEEEVKQAVEQIQGLDTIYENASTDLNDLLKTPFNLWLIERILKDPKSLPDINRVKSEVQLLGLFWKERVWKRDDRDDRELILIRLVKEMMKEHSLSSRKENVYRSEEKDTWKKLLSDEILIEISSSKQRVSFSHNILFDYAVSILMIDDDYGKLKKFILEEPSRPIFLRPSLDYYFTRLWNDNLSIFWNIYRDILLDDKSKLSLFTRLIPPLVIAREARDVQEFEYLQLLFEKKREAAKMCVMHILQAHKALQITKDLLWIQILEKFSKYIHQEFAWELTQLATNILDRTQSAGNNDIIEICGRVGRSILNWIWQKRKENQKWFDRLGAKWGVPLVAKTFKTDVSESGKLIKEIFTIIDDQTFPTDYFFFLANQLKNILPYDREIVSQIFKTVFEYEEVSEEKMDFGGIIVSLSISRRHNFQICQNNLKEHFPDFLISAPLVAVQTAIQFLNKYIQKNHVAGYLMEGIEFEKLLKRFNFRGKEAFFIPDNSAIWGDRNWMGDNPIEIADTIFKFLDELAGSGKNNNLLESILDVFRDNVKMAYFWNRLLDTGGKHPNIFAPLLFEICIARPIQVESDTIHELGVFLEKSSTNFSEEQLKQIEKSILEIPEVETEDVERAYFERKRNRLLACIPEKMLKTNEAKEIIEALKQKDRIPKNEPLSSSITTFSREFTDEDWLKDQGVKTNDEKNQQLMKLFAPIDTFEAKWRKESPDNDSIQKIFKIMDDAFQKLQNGPMAEQEVIDSLWAKLASTTEILSRSNLHPDSREFQFCREVLLKCSEHKNPIYREYFEIETAMPPIWSPAPRIEAAQGLLYLASIKPDNDILDAIEKLAFDLVPAVRFQVTNLLFKLYPQSKGHFWKIAENLGKTKKNIMIQNVLCNTLCNVVNYDEERTIKILELILVSSLDQEAFDKSHDNRIILLVWLVLTRKNQWAINKINYILDRKETPLSVFSSLIFRISKYLIPGDIETCTDQIDMAVEVLKKIMTIAFENIIEYLAAKEDELNEKQKEKITNSYQLINNIILRLYSHSDNGKMNHENPASDEQLKIYYFKIKPLLEKVVSSVSPKGKIFLLAQTAHHFMKILNNILKFDPKGALNMASKIASSSKPSGYNFDSLAVEEVVKIVETILADHRNEVQEPSSLKDLVNLLDIFAETGWPEAIRLTWRLDEIFR